MVGKLVKWSLAPLALGFLVLGADLWGVLVASRDQVKEEVEDRLPTQTQIVRCKNARKKIREALAESIEIYSKLELQAASLERRKARLERANGAGEQLRKECLAINEALKGSTGSEKVSFEGRDWSRAGLAARLKQTFDALRLQKDYDEAIAVSQEALASQMAAIRQLRSDLSRVDLAIERIEAQRHLLEAESRNVPDPVEGQEAVREADRIIEGVERRLALKKRVVENSKRLLDAGEGVADESRLSREVDAYFADAAQDR